MSNTPQIEDGYTKIANDILENLCKINLSAYQTRILLLIFRKTYGYNKKEDWISVSQIVEITGLYKSHVSRTKKELLLRGLVTSNGNKIAFQKDSKLWKELPKQVTIKKVTNLGLGVTNLGQKVTNLGQKLPVQADTKDNIQKTITKDNIQKKYSSIKNLTQQDLEEIAIKYKVPISFVQSKLDDMTNWMSAKGKTYKNYKAALSNWVKSDALKVEQQKRQENRYKVETIKL